MIEEKIIKAATEEFEQKLRESMKELPMKDLTVELAKKFGEGLKQSISSAAITGYQTFLESYDVSEDIIEIDGKQKRFKFSSKKNF